MRVLVQQSDEEMEKILFKELIFDIGYTHLLYVLNMMEPLAIINKVKAETRKYSEKLKQKHNINSVRNSCMTLDYMDNPGPG